MFGTFIKRIVIQSRLLSTTNEGSIVKAGGAFAKREHAQEELYFYKLQKERIQTLKKLLEKEEEILKRDFKKSSKLSPP